MDRSITMEPDAVPSNHPMTMPAIPIVRTIENLRSQVDAWHSAGEFVGLVPTMGSLHAGHLSLVDIACKHSDRVIVSIFVNPAQFAAHEDLGTYPRNEADDVHKLSNHTVDLIYAPDTGEMYPDGFLTTISVDDLSTCLCGASRPHFFGGVTTVVAKLFLQCRPDVAIFGEKDFQQLLIVRRMARDLDMPVDVIGGPIIREGDGLAMSSRNAYLSAADRTIAPLLYRVMMETAGQLAGDQGSAAAIESGRAELTRAGFEIDYFEVRDAETLKVMESSGEPSGASEDIAELRLFVAARLGETRLIDSVVVAGARPVGT